MLLKISQTGHPVLREPAKTLSIDEIKSTKILKLIELMKETMRDAPGVGLAAPQIGESLQLIVIEDREEYSRGIDLEQLQARSRVPVPFHVIINPILTIEENSTAEFYEGCLSISGFMGIVPRALAVKVQCLDAQAKPVTIHAHGWYARILQHEIDHLQGTLFIDRVKTRSFTTIENYNKFNNK